MVLRRARKNVGFVCALSGATGGGGDDDDDAAMTEKRRETIVGGSGKTSGIGFPNIERRFSRKHFQLNVKNLAARTVF